MPGPKRIEPRTSAPERDNRSADPETRPKRVPVQGYRDILTVANKDPNWYYKWVKDVNHKGSRIMQHLQAGFQLVDSGDHSVGEDMVAKVDNDGSVIRIPQREGALFLMRQPMEFYNEDRRDFDEKVDETERQLWEADEYDGQYGQVKPDNVYPRAR